MYQRYITIRVVIFLIVATAIAIIRKPIASAINIPVSTSSFKTLGEMKEMKRFTFYFNDGSTRELDDLDKSLANDIAQGKKILKISFSKAYPAEVNGVSAWEFDQPKLLWERK